MKKSEGKQKKKGCWWLLWIFVLIIISFIIIGNIVDSITAKSKLHYRLLDDGTYSVSAGEKNTQEEIIIPSTYNGKSVTNISGFSNLQNLKSIIIPDTVTSVGQSAFADCSNLNSITLPDSIIYIGQKAFNNTGYYNNDNNWENGVLYIGNHLYSAKNLATKDYTINNGTKTIADDAFSHKELRKITIPDSVVSIGYSASDRCEYLNKIVLGNSVKYIYNRAFNECNNIQEVHIGDLKMWCSIEFGDQRSSPFYYGGGAKIYLDGTVLTNLLIPDEITNIKDYAFYNCYFIKNVTFPKGLKQIGAQAFDYCSGLTSIVLPEGLTTLGKFSFRDCFRLKSITLPSSLSKIEEHAFDGCKTLIEIVNNSKLSISCKSSEHGKIAYHSLVICQGESNLDNQNGYLFYTVNDENYLLGYTGEDTELTLPEYYNGETYKIYRSSFEYSEIKKVTIPIGVTEIGGYAFRGCEKLTHATIGRNVIFIDECAFACAINSVTFEIIYGWQADLFGWKDFSEEVFKQGVIVDDLKQGIRLKRDIPHTTT